ncbi:MAG: hypothetical protein ACYTAS_06420, partial [Planctomycetota bacterium]
TRVKNEHSGDEFAAVVSAAEQREAMRVLIANLKHLYQCRGMWAQYAGLGVSVLIWWLLGFFDIGGSVGLGACMMVNLLLGICIGGLEVPMLARPFAYCLPGHRRTPRRVMLVVGVCASAAMALLALDRHGLSVPEAPGRTVALFFMGLAAFLLGTPVPLARSTAEHIVSLACFVPMAVYVLWSEFFDSALVNSPGIFVAVGLALCVALWRHLRGERCARSLCGQVVYGMGESPRLHSRKAKRAARALSAKKRGSAVTPWVESFFVARMRGPGVSSRGRCAWGSLYLTFGPILARWTILVAIGLPVATGLAYSARGMDAGEPGCLHLFVPALLLSAGGIVLPLPLESSMLLCAGRRERLFAAMAVVGGAAALIFVSLVFVMTTASVLERILPTLFGRLHDARYVLIPLAAVPTVVAFNLLLKNLAVEWFIGVGLALFVMIWEMKTGFMTVPFLLVAAVCAWGVFALVMYRVCTKRCLVEQ